jgi:predicted dehydrogenase
MTDGRKPVAAVVGLGVGEAHARAYLAAGCEVRWLVDLDGERAAALGAELGAGVAAEYEQVLSDPEVDIVSIASFDSAHFGQTLAALEAGKHVFVEKPLCTALDELQAVKRAWSAAGQPVLASNLVLRGAPLYGWLREAATKGELGSIYSYDGDYLYGRIEKIVDGWRGGADSYSVMLGGGIHLVDLMLWITGERPVAVSAVGTNLATRETTFRYDDHIAATFRFSSGLVGRVTANFGCVHPHQHVVRVFGTEQTVLYDDQGPRLYWSRDPETAPTPLDLATLPQSKGALIRDFVQAVVEKRDAAAATQHELDVIAVCVAADDAVRKGEEVAIEYC